MPTFDEEGNIIGMDDYTIALRGDDAREYILPGSIPEAHLDTTATSDDQEEHDCLHPLEHTGSWCLSEKAVNSIIEAMRSITETINGLTISCWPVTKMTRDYRRIVRWDERNRRRRLKGLPEKECPYPRIWKICIIQQKEED